jgi:predicted amidohydrolase YtcJ
VPLDPLASIAAASDIGVTGAAAAWTSGSAYAEHAENIKGEIRAGLHADIAIVDFESATVKATIVGGQTVYPG